MIRKVLYVSICLSLFSLIAGCASPTVPNVETRYEQVFIPDRFLIGCKGPEWSGGSFRDLAELAERRRTVIKDCDSGFEAIREYQDSIRGGN